jgi:hypothetical protein
VLSGLPDSVVNNMTTLYVIDGSSGSSLADSINNEPATTDATLLEQSQFAEGFALDFDPSNNERLRTDNQVDLNSTAQSVAAWVNFDVLSGGDVILYMGDQTNGGESRDDGWYIRISSSSDVNIADGRLGGTGASEPLSVDPDPDISTNEQYLIAATCERSSGTDTFNLFVYDNTELVASGSATNNNRVTTSGTFLYGMREPTKTTVDGKQDFVMFNESTAVSQSTFDSIHSDTKSGR